MLLKFISVLLPWRIRRLALIRWFDFEIHPSARMGWCWIFPKKLLLKEGAKIDHFTVAINLERMEIGVNATIGRNNWITGFPEDTDSPHFRHQRGRTAALILGDNSSITKSHHIDCTNRIEIGRFSTIAGYNSQLLTHSIDVAENRQDSKSIRIGDYTFIGTNVVILGGAELPAHSVLGAKSLLNKKFINEWRLYAGVPAAELTEIPKEAKYFSRQDGFVY